MKLITKRMTIMSLTPEQMMMYMRSVHDLEKELTLAYHAEPLEGKFRDVVKRQARLCEDDEDNFLWHTFWMLNLDRELIGWLHFNGMPDRDGMVELVIGVSYDYANQDYDTEAVNKITDWALRQDDVKFITVETGKDDHAAHLVLQKCGYEKYKATEHAFRWMADRNMLVKKKENGMAQALTEAAQHNPVSVSGRTQERFIHLQNRK